MLCASTLECGGWTMCHLWGKCPFSKEEMNEDSILRKEWNEWKKKKKDNAKKELDISQVRGLPQAW